MISRHPLGFLAFGVMAALLLLTVPLLVANFQALRADVGLASFTFVLLLPVIGPTFGLVGLMITYGQRRNLVGWLFLTAALGMSLFAASYNWVIYVFLTQGGQGFGAEIAAAYLQSLSTVPVFLPISLSLLLFPDGRLPGKWWRGAVLLNVVAVGFFGFTAALEPNLVFALLEDVRNPNYISWIPERARASLILLGAMSLLAAFASTAASLMVRYRRGDEVARHQLKWVALAGALLVAAGLNDVLIEGQPALTDTLDVLAFASIPVAAGVAITRYRLYDVDILISRSLVYGPLTGILAGTYTASIVFFRLVFVDLLGVDSDAAVASTTLAVAALFIPVRNFVQRFVDRLFKDDERKRLMSFANESSRVVGMLDSERLVAEFQKHVRDATDATAVGLELNVPESSTHWSSGEAPPVIAARVGLNREGVEVGRVYLAPPAGGGDFRPSDIDLVAAAGAQVAQALIILGVSRAPADRASLA